MAQRKHRRRRKLELYSKFLIPIPVGFLVPFAIMLTLDQAKDPDPFPLLSILLGVGFLALPTALFQVLIGLPTIAALRGKSLLAHVLTGTAISILMVVSQGFGDLASEMAGSMTPSSTEKFGGNRTTLDNPVPPMRFASRDKNNVVREQATLGEIFMQIAVFGLPMMLGYLMVWSVFTALPDAEHRALTAERPPPSEKPFRNLRGEVRERHGKVVTQRKKRRVRRSL